MEFDQILEEVRTALQAHFGEALFFRSGTSPEVWRSAQVLEIFPRNTAAASAELEADSAGLTVTIGSGIDCVFVEFRPHAADAASWAIEVLANAGDHGIEMWKDPRPHVLGGTNRVRIVGEPWVDVTARRQRHMKLLQPTEPWTRLGTHLLPDPSAPEHESTAFLVDDRLPEKLKEIAIAVRREFGSAVSVVTRDGRVGGRRFVEILPSNRQSTRMRVEQTDRGEIETSTGHDQYFEYEFERVPTNDPVEWILNVGRYGLLETAVRRGRAYWFVNGPAHPGAVSEANAQPNTVVSLWQPWAAQA